MTPKVKKWVTRTGYPLAYLGLLMCFARATFPFERLRDRIVGDFNMRRAPDSRLRIADMTGYWLSGVEASGIELLRTPKLKSDAPPSDAKPKVMTVDSAHVSLSLLRLLFGTTAISFGAKAFGGEMDGKMTSNSSEIAYDLELEKFNVSQLPFFDDFVGLPMKGSLKGQLELVLTDRNWAKSDGKIAFKIGGLKVGDGKAKVLGAIALPEINVGTLDFGATVTTGRLKVDKLGAAGADLDLNADGGIRMRDPLGTSTLDLTLRFRFSDKYKIKNDTTKALLGAPDSPTPGLFELTPQVQRSKRSDGFYGWHIGGTLDHPTFEPAAAAGTNAGPRAHAK